MLSITGGKFFIMNRIYIKSISAILSGAMVLTSADFSYGSTLFKTTSHAQRHLVQNAVTENTCIVKDPYLVSIPQSLGTIVEHFKGDKDSLIIHIQDRHIDPTAQLNIAGIVAVSYTHLTLPTKRIV